MFRGILFGQRPRQLTWSFGGLAGDAMDEPVDVIPLTGFDPDGEPEIRMMADGSLYVVFNFMPPSWAEDDPDPFDAFDQQLAKAVGLPVDWEDREFFRIQGPAKDTVERIRCFLAAYKRQ